MTRRSLQLHCIWNAFKSNTSDTLARICLKTNLKSYMSYNLSCRNEAEALLKVTKSHTHRQSGKFGSVTRHGHDYHSYAMTYGLSNSAISDDFEWLSTSFVYYIFHLYSPHKVVQINKQTYIYKQVNKSTQNTHHRVHNTHQFLLCLI